MEARDVIAQLVGKPKPACPFPGCGVRFAPTGLAQPYVVGPGDEVYCRHHGARVFPGYEHELRAYNRRRRAGARLLTQIEAAEPASPEAERWVRVEMGLLDVDEDGRRR